MCLRGQFGGRLAEQVGERCRGPGQGVGRKVHPFDVATWATSQLEQFAGFASEHGPEAITIDPDEPGLCHRQPTGDPRP